MNERPTARLSSRRAHNTTAVSTAVLLLCTRQCTVHAAGVLLLTKQIHTFPQILTNKYIFPHRTENELQRYILYNDIVTGIS